MIEQLSHAIIQLISAHGYSAVFILMLLESMLLPIPSEVTMAYAGFLAQQGHVNLWLVIFVGAFANLVGSVIAYAVGYYLEDAVLLSLIRKYGKFIFLREHEYVKALTWFEKYGAGVTFFSRILPVVRTFISLPAGLAKMNIWKFSAYTFAGCFIWSALLTYMGFVLGKNWDSLHGLFQKFQIGIIVSLVLLVLWYINSHLKIIKFSKKK